ncbi:hypothetical protein Y032_0009g429 [Ancylostoma ceylanicum]|nr:hypothetical protein Y032_0009g429 [Ancylostoma ceylanicum]
MISMTMIRSIIPFIFIFIPLVLLMLSVTSENVFDSQKETPYYAKLLPAVALGLFSFYSIAHITVMISFTAPYRQYISGLLRRVRKQTTVSNSTGTISVI